MSIVARERRHRCLLATLALLAATAGVTPAFAAEDEDPPALEMVGVELVLLVDTSGSVDETEYQLQQQGYVDAFRHESLIKSVERYGGIAVTYVEWSSADHQNVRIPWTRLDDATDCRNFASEVDKLTRTHEGWTRLAPALDLAATLLETNAYSSFKRVIDVSGDGRCQNYDYYNEGNDYNEAYGIEWDEAIARLSGRVDVVNGICITTSENVISFYRDILIQGDGAFMMQVSSFTAFGEAILTKLLREIGRVPGTYD